MKNYRRTVWHQAEKSKFGGFALHVAGGDRWLPKQFRTLQLQPRPQIAEGGTFRVSRTGMWHIDKTDTGGVFLGKTCGGNQRLDMNRQKRQAQQSRGSQSKHCPEEILENGAGASGRHLFSVFAHAYSLPSELDNCLPKDFCSSGAETRKTSAFSLFVNSKNCMILSYGRLRSACRTMTGVSPPRLALMSS